MSQEINKKKNFNIFKSHMRGFMSYSTERSATIKSVKIGLVYRIAQILLLSYIVGWELMHNKGYQEFDTVSSVVTTKVKGQGFLANNLTIETNLKEKSNEYFENLFSLKSNVEYHMLDTADYVIPPNEYNSVFIMSNFLKTKQTQDRCPEESTKYKAICQNDSDCENLGSAANSWNGIPTGKCIRKDNKTNIKIFSWCPVEDENDRNEDQLIRNVLNFTIFIKNDIEFKKFKKKLRNVLPYHTNSYLQTCTYHEEYDPHCPIFQLNYILSLAEPDIKEKYLMMIKGGVILIEILWNCDFDFTTKCLPKYSFRRFDTKETNTASGFNFRFANRYRQNNIEVRELYKAFGLRFIINVSGLAGKFSIVPLMITIGAGIGLMSISVIVADCVLLHCTKKKRLYQEIKELDVNSVLEKNFSNSVRL
ncbi:unnamed protein product [Brachionus calyciflorus]|uniref:Purinergic receptor n=1 Tax=Brachionus calyciflorus TaxID=104777 RepID=A0A814BND1_9BILA|nr:unnamed protein product [Brachionus calyciflorus]